MRNGSNKSVYSQAIHWLLPVVFLAATGCGGGSGNATIASLGPAALPMAAGGTTSVSAAQDTNGAVPGLQVTLSASVGVAAAGTTVMLYGSTPSQTSQPQLLGEALVDSMGVATFQAITVFDGQRLEVRNTSGVVMMSTEIDVQDGSTSQNRPPVATVALSQVTVEAGTAVNVSGAASDPDGDALAYDWSRVSGPQAVLTNPDKAQMSFTPSEGIYELLLRVSDGRGGVSTAAVSLLAVQMSAAAKSDVAAASSNVIAFHTGAGGKTEASCRFCHGKVLLSKTLNPAFETVHFRHVASATGPGLECVACHAAVDLVDKSAAHIRRQVSMSLCVSCHGTRFFATRTIAN